MKLWQEYSMQAGEGDLTLMSDMFIYIELVLDSHGQICMQNRLHGQNEVSYLDNILLIDFLIFVIIFVIY